MKMLLAFRVVSGLGEGRAPHRASVTPEPTPSPAVRAAAEAAAGEAEAASPAAVCAAELERMRRKTGSGGGVICLSADGRPGLAHTSTKMAWAVARPAEGGQASAEGGVDPEVLCGIDQSEAPPDIAVVRTDRNGTGGDATAGLSST
jgi:hypothetical protein